MTEQPRHHTHIERVPLSAIPPRRGRSSPLEAVARAIAELPLGLSLKISCLDLADAIAEAERVDPLNGWTAVSSGLPFAESDNREPVRLAVLLKGTQRREAFFGSYDSEIYGPSFGWFWDDDEIEEWCDPADITHYRDLSPLPEVEPVKLYQTVDGQLCDGNGKVLPEVRRDF